MSRPHHQLGLPPSEVPKDSPSASPRTNDTQPDVLMQSASFLFDAALRDARVTSAEAAHLMGISESLVNRMRSPNYRECVSLVQLLRCGPSVVWHFHRILHKKQQFHQLALREALQSLSLLAVGLE